ncbi:MAG: hypothetical protein IJE15_09845 [Bacteroidaceae bacterium]|nr:hypothetical protein [Bacteroidaceae bacterium]
MNATATSQSSASSVANQANGCKSFSPSANPDKFGRKHTRKVTVDTALEAIHRKFSNLADILSIEDESIIDIILKDLYSNKYFEVFSNREHTKLQIKQIIF